MDESKVTVGLEELAKLVRHAELSLYWYNLPRQSGDRVFHRCLQIAFLEHADGTTLQFLLLEDNNVKQTVTHKLRDLFELLPRLNALLGAQAWVPDTFIERAYQVAANANEDSRVLLSAFEASAMRRWKAERDRVRS